MDSDGWYVSGMPGNQLGCHPLPQGLLHILRNSMVFACGSALSRASNGHPLITAHNLLKATIEEFMCKFVIINKVLRFELL